MKSETQRLWHVRLAGTVRGPFPAAAIARDMVLGRLPAHVELSVDQIGWSQPAELSTFSHLLVSGRTDPSPQERELMRRRWADERGGHDRRNRRRHGRDRRQADASRRAASSPKRREPRTEGWLAVGSLVAILAAMALAAAALGSALPVNLVQ